MSEHAAHGTVAGTDLDEIDDPDLDDPDGDADLAPRRGATAARGRRRGASWGKWSRWLHVYTSMISLLVVLFFGITGLTLNHPSWSFGGGPTSKSVTGTLPAGFADGTQVDFLTVAEYVRDHDGVRGSVADHQASDTEGTISFKGPGYAADLIFEIPSGEYRLLVEEQGLLGVLNDLHKGRDTGSKWKWLIDVSAIFLVAVAITGLGIQVFQRKRRRRALTFAAGFSVVSLVLILVTMR